MLTPILICDVKEQKMKFLNMKKQYAKNRSGCETKQAGFSLVELMVGLVIGLFATLAIMQVFGVFEGQKRTTSGTADAQISGSVALYNLQRDIKQAGFGLPLFDAANMPLRCTATTVRTTATGTSMSIPINLTPIVILDGGNAAGASDSIRVNYGSSASAGVPAEVVGIAANTVPGRPVNIINNMNCNNNDFVIAINGNTCVAQQVTPAPPFPNAINLTSIPRSSNTSITLHSNAGINVGDTLSCVGGWNTATFAINVNNQLTRTGDPIVDGIVNLQAQYGISNQPDDNQIRQWVNATGVWATTINGAGEWVPPGVVNPTCNAASANRNCIKAVRVAVVARNSLLERDVVTTAAVNAWDAASANPIVASPAPTINLTNTPNWNRYRYKVYESVIPLRNLVWTKDNMVE